MQQNKWRVTILFTIVKKYWFKLIDNCDTSDSYQPLCNNSIFSIIIGQFQLQLKQSQIGIYSVNFLKFLKKKCH